MRRKHASAEASGRETVGFRRRREKHERAAAFLAGKPLLVGLDLAKKEHAVWMAGPDLVPIRRFMTTHSHEGLAKLLARADAARALHGLDRVIVFMEATSHFWENVANVLEARDVAYRTVSPLAVDRQREIEHITYAKGDYRDAELISQLGKSGHWLHRVLEREPLWLRLRALAREHEDLLEAQTADRLRIRSLLELALPEVLECFDDPLGHTSRALLKRLSRPPAEIPTTFPEVVTRAGQVDGHRILRGKLRALVARLQVAPSFGVESALAASLGRIGLAVDRFELLRDQRDEVRAQLVTLYEATPYRTVLDTIPGVSPESHALLLGFTGDPKQYDRASCLVKLAGTEPRENHSGQAEGSHSISRRGRSPLRSVVYRIVLGFRLGNPEFSAYLTRLRSREKNPLSWYQAAVATGNKYLRLVHHLCLEGKPYDPSRLTARV